VRNWSRLGVFAGAYEDDLGGGRTITTNDRKETLPVPKLTRRANKTLSSNSFIPAEYCDADDAQCASEILALANTFSVKHAAALFSVTLALLVARNEVQLDTSANSKAVPQFKSPLQLASFHSWKRKNICTEIQNWFSQLSTEISSDFFNHLLPLVRTTQNSDFLGLLLQSLQATGAKNKNGSYFTPETLVDDILSSLGIRPNENPDKTLLDPACGTGKFLLRAATKGFSNPTQLYGIELDELAWRIARINLLLAFPEHDFVPNIFHGDALLGIATGVLFSPQNELLEKFDYVVTNPPWGAKNKKHGKDFKIHFTEINSGESFSHFTLKCLRFAKTGGQVALILPESILNVAAHKDIRKIILEQSKIKNIRILGRCFSGVFTNAISLHLEKNKPAAADFISVKNEQKQETQIKRERFLNNRDNIFDILVHSADADIIDFLYAQPHCTLQNNADWALGIVTGDNAKFLTEEKNNGAEPIYRGCEIAPFRKATHKYFIHFTPERFQQTAPEWKYRTREKIIYKFISNRLTFAYDTDATLTLNSANILIPRIANLSLKVVLAFLNSSIAQFVHSKRFNTFKILRKNLEELPIPKTSPATCAEIETLSISATNGEKNILAIDALFAHAFSLSTQQLQHIQNATWKN
jgi:type I restriction-modification system DNA methylase subunit